MSTDIDNADLKLALDDLSSTKSDIDELESLFSDSHPDEWVKYRELKAALPGLQETAKTFLRSSFQDGGNIEAYGHVFVVKRGNKEVKVDIASLMDRARERNEMERLIHMGFLEYAVNTAQLDRLPGELKAVYSEFVRITHGTPKVSLPKNLT